MGNKFKSIRKEIMPILFLRARNIAISAFVTNPGTNYWLFQFL
jgi:hypothetical protein